MSAKIQNMTEGKPFKLIIMFALPLMLGNVFQQLYTVMDTLIVGRALGVSALAALGATDWTVWLVLGIITGFTQGFSILMAQEYGAGNMERLKKVIENSITLSIVLSILVFAIVMLIQRPILLFLHTPDAILTTALTYMTILFCGIPIITMYNLLASILRSLGDSKTPLIAMVIASIVNIVLDLVFILIFHLGVGGAALGTVAAQLCASLICFIALKKTEIFKLIKMDFKLDGMLVEKLLFLGCPIAFQNAIIAVGGMVVQFVINGFGVLFIAGFTATNKLYGILEMAAISYGFAMTTYVGQNYGAGRHARVRSGVRSALVIGIVTACLISLCMLFLGRNIVGWFITGEAADVTTTVNIAYRYLSIMSIFLPVLYLLYIYRAAIQGMGDTLLPMVSGIAECIMRVGTALILPLFFGEDGIFFAEILAWLGADVILIPSYYTKIRKFVRNL